MSLSICVSFLEITYFYFTKTTMIEFLYADEKKPFGDSDTNEEQEEAIRLKSMFNPNHVEKLTHLDQSGRGGGAYNPHPLVSSQSSHKGKKASGENFKENKP